MSKIYRCPVCDRLSTGRLIDGEIYPRFHFYRGEPCGGNEWKAVEVVEKPPEQDKQNDDD